MRAVKYLAPFCLGLIIPIAVGAFSMTYKAAYTDGLRVGRLRGCGACFRRSARQSYKAIWEICRDAGDYRRRDPFEAKIDERCL